MPVVTGVAHLSLTVRNLPHSEQWYRDVFGFERVHAEHRPHFDSVVMADPVSGVVVSLRQHHGAGTARFDETRTGLDHVSFGVASREELDAWRRRLEEHHVEHSPVADTPFGAVLVLRDPDHIQLELAWLSDGPGVRTGLERQDRPAAETNGPGGSDGSAPAPMSHSTGGAVAADPAAASADPGAAPPLSR